MYRHKAPPTAKKQDATLYKFKSSYDKVLKEMNETPKDYDTIKELIESKNNSITKLENNINKKSKIIYKSNLIKKKI